MFRPPSLPPSPRRVLTCVALAAVTGLGVLAAEVLWALRGGGVAFSPVSPAPRAFVSAAGGQSITLVVMGDSTAVGQGAEYESGIAVAAAQHLARRGPVILRNLGVSGATWTDVRAAQLPAAVRASPDVVVLAAGANDVTHLTPLGSVQRDIEHTVAALRAANPRVRVVLTGAPDMGAVPRFLPPLRWVATWRTRRLNAAVEKTAAELAVTVAPIARRTGALFRSNRGLFAADDFHPNARGYATWNPVLAEALDRALGRLH